MTYLAIKQDGTVQRLEGEKFEPGYREYVNTSAREKIRAAFNLDTLLGVPFKVSLRSHPGAVRFKIGYHYWENRTLDLCLAGLRRVLGGKNKRSRPLAIYISVVK